MELLKVPQIICLWKYESLLMVLRKPLMWSFNFENPYEHIVQFLIQREIKAILCIRNISRGLPWRSSGKESAFQCGGSGFDPWSGSEDRTWRGATKPVRHSYWAPLPQLESLRAANYRAHAPWSLRTTTREEKTHTPQLERSPHAATKDPHASTKIPRAATKTRCSQKEIKIKK